jgi:lipoate synthase
MAEAGQRLSVEPNCPDCWIEVEAATVLVLQALCVRRLEYATEIVVNFKTGWVVLRR